jgi:N-acetylglutamate synthase-like GNAT family acetyltransferase
MENVKIEFYHPKFHDSTTELILRIQREEFGVPITLADQPDLNKIESFYQQGTGNFWVALVGEDVVGTIALIDIGNKEVALRKMFVSQEFRGKPHRLGQRLLDVAVSWSIERNVKEIILGTLDRFQAAQKFYRKNGFIEIAKNDLPDNFPKMSLDNTFFRKQVHNVEILEYQPEHQQWFEKLNRKWIEQHFWMEPVDFDVLQSPEKHIIAKGGSILMVSVNSEIVGTVALKHVEGKVFEFTKMAVDEKFRGQKVGRRLAEAAIAKAKDKGADKIILYSNTVLSPAIALYKKLGFKEIPVDGPYKRSNIKMELIL